MSATGRAFGTDGVADAVDLFSAGLASAFNGPEGTLFLEVDIPDSGFFGDANVKWIFGAVADVSNRLFIHKGGAANQLRINYRASDAVGIAHSDSSGITGRRRITVAWRDSTVSGETTFVVDGTIRSGSGSVNAWAGTIVDAVFAAQNNTPLTPAPLDGGGRIAIYNVAHSDAVLQALTALP